MTRRRPSRHVRRVRTKHGRRARVINPHLHRARRARVTAAEERRIMAPIVDAIYQQHLDDQALREDRGLYAALPRPRRFVAIPKPPPQKLPWYGLKVTVRKRRRRTPGRRRMRVSADVLDERITRALEAGATLEEVQPLIAEQADKDEYRFSLRGPRGPRHAR